ncbi:MAG: hypothetical protein WDZ79_01520 [Candidatus Paceibacterota bacterium]
MSPEITSVFIEYVRSPAVLWAFFGVVVVLVAVISLVLRYHWRNYGVNRVVIAGAQFVYLIGVAALLVGAFLSLCVYFLI